MQYHYLVVEGPHDAAAIAKMLRLLGAVQIKKKITLDRLDSAGYFETLTSLNFPYNDDMTERMPVPLFFRFGEPPEMLIAVHAAQGESALMKTMSTTLSNLNDNGATFTSLAIFGDADNRKPLKALRFYQDQLQGAENVAPAMTHLLHFPLPGLVLERGHQRIGAYVLPDNERSGTLETVLLECATTHYGNMRAMAEQYVNAFAPSEWIASKKQKAIVGCMNNILRPGTSNTVSIEKDEWFCDASMTTVGAQRLLFFVQQLLGMEPCSREPEQPL